ncbi:proprotein convertase subtilisin/kexin type 6-like [Mercenaria mercenaria]|uniref:proprotein convertase subtilisin/kexin type 6-like n=1 Tax=Mercenaria mercenaria TaxID=6596 RepID=UPI00234FA83E|nr:proprotein convertase subtilisin/kexin type 6-like [Mercenaria mercenaria]
MTFITWLVCLLVHAGDVHPNPGPSSTHSVSSTCSSTSTISQSLSDLMSGTCCLSVLHNNVQSLFNKVDVLEAEFSSFDVLSFSETWLSSSDLSDDIRFRGFHAPERKDRKGDSHGGVIVYVKNSLHYIRRPDLEPTDLECIWVEASVVCSNDYGMGVTKVWKRNITGKGVTIAVNDVGINTDLIDLEPNINKKLCKNFLTNDSDVTPESFDILDKAPFFTDHGNKVASVVAAVKNNYSCCPGIAYDATIVALKIFEVALIGNWLLSIRPNHFTTSDIISKALTYELDKIDVFVNAWTSTELFAKFDLATRNAITHGATTGRRGLGTIYVVPAASCGNEFSNNIHTITVNSIGRYGTKPFDVLLDASVLVSGLRNGNNLTASTVVTASHGNKCVTNFKGVSVAVSQVSAIIALGLQANPDLTLRDVQHLLVQASYHEGLVETTAFRSNGAFRYFHNFFGFGLLNADRFVQLASNHTSVPTLDSLNLHEYQMRTSGYRTQIFEFCYSCDIYSDETCLTSIEHVTTSINFTTSDNRLKIKIISPSKTHSVLMALTSNKKEMPLSKEGKLVSVHFWDEVPVGKWHIRVQNRHSLDQTKVMNISLQIHGTRRALKVYLAADMLNACCTEDDEKLPETPKTTSAAPTAGLDITIVVNAVLLAYICVVATTFGFRQ